MKVLRQLLREFWLPLLLGAGWTAFNVIGGPSKSWTVRSVLNVFGPTFFFMSWLVAQWYRVTKQQRVEEGIESLHTDVRAIQSPLLPCGLFLTLRIEAQEDDLGRVFGEQPGYRAYGRTVPMPPPPAGLPPGIEDGRLFLTRRTYIDYRNGVVEAAGVYRHNHPGYNVLHREILHTVAVFHKEGRSESLSENEPLFCTPLVTLEIYLGGKPGSPAVPPTLVLKRGIQKAPMVVGACALDNTVIVDHVFQSLAVTPADTIGYSSGSLRGAFVRLTLDFFFLEGVATLPEESWPKLHNFQIWFGGKARQLFTFSSEDLKAQITRVNPKPIVRGGAVCPQILFEYEVRPDVFVRNFLSAE
jgi:hypothetical protein